MKWFFRQSIKGGRVGSINQYPKSKICDDILKIISEELNLKGNIYDFKEAYLNYRNKHFEIFEKEYETQFNNYRVDMKKKKKNLSMKS